MTWSDVDFAAKKITLRRQVVYLKKQGYTFSPLKNESSNRCIIVDDFLLGELKRWQTQQADNETQFEGSYVYIYRDSDGRLILGNIPVKNLRAEGLNVHSFRHTHATQLIESGASANGVAGRLGHSNPQITQNVYVHNTLKLQEETAQFSIKTCRQILNADSLQTNIFVCLVFVIFSEGKFLWNCR